MNAMLRLVAWILALALVALPVVAVLNGWIGASQWPLKRLRVTGEFERVDPAALRKVLLPYAQRGYFAVDLAAARNAVAKLAWVERAEVRKRWPDVLEVVVVEHRPFARWGGDRLLSEQGRLFPARGIEVPAELPLFVGPETRVAEVVALYNQSRALFAPLGLRVEKVELDPRGSWSLGLAGGAQIVLGRSEARARMGRFVRLLPQLLASQTRVLRRADLRYTNGFALMWEDAAPPREAANDAAPAPAAPPRTAALRFPNPPSPFPNSGLRNESQG
ncbi:cell division protein FtsQ/DivIB [Vulcaniibacterium tengchongense]|uniref:Cell division protein FtsQ n=1 Tax=Vulcaniibacterium tengchongense TaxID=1273429 RepID=A0A3N4VJL1_9GAMM|nr:cell division protein FtsQ/DivIB [Vulcaniibacterium tengchongense]RPE79521.1 cell division protein FtsQ [Vulcaniibacterium tengchongense]